MSEHARSHDQGDRRHGVSIGQYRSMLTRYVLPQRRDASILGGLLLLGIALPLLSPQIVRVFIDRAVAGEALPDLVRLAALYVAVAIGLQITSVLRAWFGERVGWTATNELRAELTAHALSLDLPFHNRTTPGEMIERVDGDVNAISVFFSQFVVTVLGSFLLLLGVLAVVLRENLVVGLVLVAFTVVMGSVLGRLRSLAIPSATAERQAFADLFGFLEERLAGTDDLRALGAGDHVMRGFARVTGSTYRAIMRSERRGAAIWVSTSGMFAAGNLLALALGAWLYRGGSITLGTVYLLFQYMNMLRQPLEEMANQIRQLQEAGAGISRVGKLREVRTALPDRGTRPFPLGPLSVELHDVSFHYQVTEPVLRDVSFNVEPGRVLGIVGRTGSGKTTIGRLLARLYDPVDGEVRLGGVALPDTPLAEVRRRVGVVTQDVQLFHATVRENLTLFDDSIDDDRLLGVVEELGLATWFSRLASGLDTTLAGGARSLSAGEAQLVAFARVFLRDPGLVILDEASSRLDPATEHLIEQAVDRLLVGRTGIVIAHRLGTIERADDVLVLEHGRVVEHGPRDRLAARRSSRLAGLIRTGLAIT